MAPITLICLPYAGAGASQFRRWQAAAPDGLRIHPVQLPGREERFAEPPHTDMTGAVNETYAELAARVDLTRPAAVFGHSLGAVLGYELTRLLAARGTPPVRLFVSGSSDPWHPRPQHAHGLSDEEFMTQVRRFAGYRHPAMDDPDMLEVLLPTLRADVELHEMYRPSSSEPLAVPITALRGTGDDLVRAAEMTGWRGATSAGFRSVELPGGHMYLVDRSEDLLALIAGDVLPLDADARR
jgi:surfactin synthase thioesterase subunit